MIDLRFPSFISRASTFHRLVVAVFMLTAAAAQAVEIRFVAVAPGVYAHIGDLAGRTVDNEGLNANVGLVVTPGGSVLIDSGATFAVARKIEAAAAALGAPPIRWVINTGGQDHRWLGNGYFAARGAEVIGHAAGRADMQSRGGDQLAALRSLLGERAAGTVPRLPDRWIDAPDQPLVLGGMPFELIHRGGGHTPGDMMVWLPKGGVLFTGDIVYVDRLLAVLPVSNTKAWLAAFEQVERLRPKFIVPGHGHVTGLPTAQMQTRDYLRALRTHMARAVQQGTDLGEAVRSFDAGAWRQMPLADVLGAGNANRAYLEAERE